MEYLLLVGLLTCVVLFVVSFYTPRTVKFLKAPSKLKGILFWFFMTTLCFSGLYAAIPESYKNTKPQQVTASPSQNVQPSQSENFPASAPVAPQYTQLPYYTSLIEDSSARADRKRVRVSIVLDAATAPITAENLAATCVGAAKHYITETSAKVISVVLYDQQGMNWGHTQLALCNYSPDNGGWSGSQGWTWEKIEAAERTTTQQEKDITRLWNEMRGKFQKNGSTDEKALSATIAKQLGTPEKTVTLPYLSSEKVNPEAFLSVPAKGPDESPVVQPNQTEVTREPQKVQATTTTKAVQKTELPWSRKGVIANYNAAASALNLPRVNAENAQHTQNVADAWNYTLSPYTGIVLSSNLGSSHITSAIFIGAGDGTQQSGAAIILSAICTVTALTPDATGDQRSALFKKLGLLDGSISDGKDHKAMFGPVKFSASFTTTTGLMLTASPVEQKQSPKAQKPARSPDPKKQPSHQTPQKTEPSPYKDIAS